MSSETAKRLAEQEKPANTADSAAEAQAEPAGDATKKNKQKDDIKPVSGRTSTPPTIPNSDAAEATK